MFVLLNSSLVGGFNPSEKYARQMWIISGVKMFNKIFQNQPPKLKKMANQPQPNPPPSPQNLPYK